MIVLKLARGVSGYDLVQQGLIAPKKRGRPKGPKRDKKAKYRREYEAKKKRLGMEALREKWRKAKDRRKERKALAGRLATQAQDRTRDPGLGPAPVTTEG